MSKMFVHYSGTVESFKSAKTTDNNQLLSAFYNNNIVFIKGGVDGTGAAIYTHGNYYANLNDALAGLKYISSVKAGDVIATAQGPNGIIEFSANDPTTVSVSADSTGVSIGLTSNFKKSVSDNTAAIASIKSDYLKSSDKTAIIGTSEDVSTANTIYGAKKHAEEKASAAETAAKTYADNTFVKTDGFNEFTTAIETKLESIEENAEVNIIETVKVNGVALTPDSSRAINVEIPAATVTGVKSNDKILSLNGTELVSTLTFTKETIDNKEYLIIKGIDDVEIGKVDTADFTADSFLNNVVLEGNELVFTFNTESGKDEVRVDISKYIDTYTAGNGIDITSNKVSAKIDPSSESFLTVGTNGIKLSGVQTAINTAVANKNVTADGDAYVSASASDNKVTVAATESTKTSLGKADTALQSIAKGTDGTYVTTTITTKSNNTQTIGVAVTTKTVADATSTDNGLATAYDAKSYADSLFAWEEL